MLRLLGDRRQDFVQLADPSSVPAARAVVRPGWLWSRMRAVGAKAAAVLRTIRPATQVQALRRSWPASCSATCAARIARIAQAHPTAVTAAGTRSSGTASGQTDEIFPAARQSPRSTTNSTSGLVGSGSHDATSLLHHDTPHASLKDPQGPVRRLSGLSPRPPESATQLSPRRPCPRWPRQPREQRRRSVRRRATPPFSVRK